jgi:hypothetical protein
MKKNRKNGARRFFCGCSGMKKNHQKNRLTS